jgi:dipeptidase E
MHLYLSSYRFGDEPGRLRTLAGDGQRAVVIANALDYSTDLARKNAGTARELEGLADLGFDARELDLRSYFDAPSTLHDELAGVALIWVVGGNAFLLRRAFEQSGLARYLQGRRDDDSLVYGGYSAGAVVVTPTLRGIDLIDAPDVLADGYDPRVLWDGLGLVPHCIAPHYRSAHPESPLVERVVDYFIGNELLFVALRDGEVVIANSSSR